MRPWDTTSGVAGGAAAPPESEFEDRRRGALAQCAARGLDGLLAVSRGASSVDSYADVFYLSNHYGNMGFTPDFQSYWVGRSHSAVVLAPEREPRLIVDGPDYRRDLVTIEDVRFELDFPGAVTGALRDFGLQRARIGVSGLNVMSARVHRQLLELLPGAELVDADDLVEALRVVKSPFELQKMRAAAEVGGAVVPAIMERALSPGATEAQAVAAGYSVGIAAGVAFFDTAVASGPHSNYFTFGHLPSWSGRVLKQGELFHADSYGAVEGYLFDFGRTCVVGGDASAEQRALLDAAVEAVERGIAAIRPGIRASAVFDAVHAHLRGEGLAIDESADMESASALSIGFPPHGHGLGLGWEWPWLLPTEDRELQAGMCLAVEAMPSRAGIGSTYFEQDVIVTEDGAELLTTAPKRFW
jgi:Xaa-Pro aminopeptidase